ncbi:MAG: tryptophan synthase subunit alpha [Acidimicrobiales bacterium]
MPARTACRRVRRVPGHTRAQGVDAHLLASPATSSDRLVPICRNSHGFVRSVGVMGTAGGPSPHEDLWTVVERTWAFTDTPVLIGFGVNAPHFAAHCRTGGPARRWRDCCLCADAARRRGPHSG